ncbi:MAG TPA: trehalose-phosphatase [Ktedonobacteraceae bacterium]|nr:trehalose-phosphatase [Ktedonobacteraceae bacterium]
MNTHQQLAAVLAHRPLGLAFDIDGTLSPIAPTPDEASIYPGVLSLLEQAKKYAHIAILTGRSIDDGAAMLNLDGLTYIGTHGLEWSDGLPGRHPVEIMPEALAYYEPGKYLLDLVEQHLSALPGVIVQRKRIGGTIHYRLAPDPIETREKILSLLGQPAQQVHMNLSEGKLAIEIRVPLPVHKGWALRTFLERHHLKAIVFAGDDRTDLDAVKQINRMRAEGIAALSIVVQHHDTLPELLAQADIVVQEVPGMVEIFREMVTILESNQQLNTDNA